MSVKCYDNFTVTDNTHDYETDFHFTFTVGIDEDTGNEIYVDASGYANDEKDGDYRVSCYFDDNYIIDSNRSTPARMYEDDTEIPVWIPKEVSAKILRMTAEKVKAVESEKLAAYAEWNIPDEFPKDDVEYDENSHIYTFCNVGETLGREICVDIYCKKSNVNGCYAAYAVDNTAYILVNRENETLKIPLYLPSDTEEKLIKIAKGYEQALEKKPKTMEKE